MRQTYFFRHVQNMETQNKKIIMFILATAELFTLQLQLRFLSNFFVVLVCVIGQIKINSLNNSSYFESISTAAASLSPLHQVVEQMKTITSLNSQQKQKRTHTTHTHTHRKNNTHSHMNI